MKESHCKIIRKPHQKRKHRIRKSTRPRRTKLEMELDGMTETEQTTDELSVKTKLAINDIDRNRAMRDVRTIWNMP